MREKGFTPILIIVGIFIVLTLAGSIYYSYSSKHKQQTPPQEASSGKIPQTDLSSRSFESSASGIFVHNLLDTNDWKKIINNSCSVTIMYPPQILPPQNVEGAGLTLSGFIPNIQEGDQSLSKIVETSDWFISISKRPSTEKLTDIITQQEEYIQKKQAKGVSIYPFTRDVGNKTFSGSIQEEQALNILDGKQGLISGYVNNGDSLIEITLIYHKSSAKDTALTVFSTIKFQ